MNLLQLAQQYAQLKKAKVIGHRILEQDAGIVFVLSIGHKLTWTEQQLTAEIKAIQDEEQNSVIDARDGVDEKEAATASRALNKRKTTKKASKSK